MAQTTQAFLEAEAYPGPSLIIGYSHCIAHGYDMAQGVAQQKRAVDSGVWPLYRFDPRRAAEGKHPLQLDSKEPSRPLSDYIYNEGRYRQLTQSDPDAAAELLEQAQAAVKTRRKIYLQMAEQG